MPVAWPGLPLQLSYMVLDQGISAVTFSVGNTMKRVAVVVSSVMFFRVRAGHACPSMHAHPCMHAALRASPLCCRQRTAALGAPCVAAH